ncbi:unnamed protein product [Protopolystoma xenopodis]|uniref:Uncharacterized protein n=1 Tax=Protopolystoma xenopodis TaxID=117903 RepID=A0A3S5BS70_9PLAT|nr:unnamed protein product [Protopolystoma xenopodis]
MGYCRFLDWLHSASCCLSHANWILSASSLPQSLAYGAYNIWSGRCMDRTKTAKLSARLPHQADVAQALSHILLPISTCTFINGNTSSLAYRQTRMLFCILIKHNYPSTRGCNMASIKGHLETVGLRWFGKISPDGVCPAGRGVKGRSRLKTLRSSVVTSEKDEFPMRDEPSERAECKPGDSDNAPVTIVTKLD